MGKETSFEHPPQGHIALLVWDKENKDWYAVLGDDDGHIQLDVIGELPAGTQNIGDVDVLTMPTVTVIPASGEKLFAFGGIVEQALSNTDLPGTDYNLDGTPVGAGEIYVITQAAIMYSGTVPTSVEISASGLAYDMIVCFQKPPASGTWYPFSINVILQVDDFMRGRVVGPTATDNLYFRYAGYKMVTP